MNKHNFSMLNKDVWNKNNINHENHGVDVDVYDPSIYKTISIEPNFDKWEWGSKIKNTVDHEILKRATTFLLTDNISFSQDSTWETIDLYPNIGDGNLLGSAMALGGVGEGPGTVHRSKQYWKKSGYLKMNPNVRLIDWDGEGLCEKMALLLTAYSVPMFNANVADEVANIFDSLGEKISDVGDEGNTVGKVTDKIGEFSKFLGDTIRESPDHIDSKLGDLIGLTDGSDSVVVGGLGNIAEDLREAISDYTTLRLSPPVLKVRVGSLLYHEEMILKHFSITFSNEHSYMGPLYADVTLELESRKIIKDISDTGLYRKPSKSRVVTIESENIDPAWKQVSEQGVDGHLLFESSNGQTRSTTGHGIIHDTVEDALDNFMS